MFDFLHNASHPSKPTLTFMRSLIRKLDLEELAPPVHNARSQWFYGTKGNVLLTDMPAVEVETKWMCSGFDAVPEFAQMRDFSFLFKFVICTVTAGLQQPSAALGGGLPWAMGGSEPRVWQQSHVTPEWGLETDPSHDGGVSVRAAFADSSYVTVNRQSYDLTQRPAHPGHFVSIDRPSIALVPQEEAAAPPNPFGMPPPFRRPPARPPASMANKFTIVQTIGTKKFHVDAFKASFSGDLTTSGGPLGCALADPPTAVPVLANAELLKGKMAIVYPQPEEGGATVSYLDQARRVEAAGAAACVMVAFAPVTASFNGVLKIPCLFVDKLAARRLIALPEAVLTISPKFLPPQTRQGLSEEDMLFEMYFPDFQGAMRYKKID